VVPDGVDVGDADGTVEGAAEGVVVAGATSVGAAPVGRVAEGGAAGVPREPVEGVHAAAARSSAAMTTMLRAERFTVTASVGVHVFPSILPAHVRIMSRR
jgi:hypothetical protein